VAAAAAAAVAADAGATAAAGAGLEHLTNHVVENSSVTEVQQLNVGVKTNGHLETSSVTHLCQRDRK